MGKIRGEEHHSMYLSFFIKYRMRKVERKACIGEARNAYSILVGKSQGKRPVWRLDVAHRIFLK
jgi:hypothetical protein